MIAWLFTVPQLVMNMLPTALSEPSSLANVEPSLLADIEPCILVDVPTDLFRAILLNLGFSSLYAASTTSKRFRELILPLLQSLHGIRCNGKIYFYYSTILDEFDALQADAFKGHAAVDAVTALRSSIDYMGIEAVLEAEFGFCIHHWEERLQFFPRTTLIEMLYNEKTASALPYLLDQNPHNIEWSYCLQGLAELGRVDLLHLLAFPKIDEDGFYLLSSIPLPMSIVKAAALSLQRRKPNLGLSELLAFAVLQDRDACVPKGRVPLFILQYLHENGTMVPQDCVFTDGLLEQSISFWVYLLKRKSGEVLELLDTLWKQGDYATKCMVSVFHQEVPIHIIPEGAHDMYRAMLIRFRFSPHCTEAVRANYEGMLEKLRKVDYRSVHALLDCGQSALVGKFGVCCDLSAGAMKGLIAKMYRLGDENLPALVEKYLEWNDVAPLLLKTLIHQRVDNGYIQLVWEWIQAKQELRTIGESCCLASVDSLRRLVFEEDLSGEKVQELLSDINVYQTMEGIVPKDVARLYTAIFWEAPEKVISYFFGQIIPGYILDYKTICHLRWSNRHSEALWKQLVRRCQAPGDFWTIDLESFRLKWKPHSV